MQASVANPHQTLPSMSLWNLLCAQLCWKRKGYSPNCSHKVGSMELFKISLYAEAFRVYFTGTKEPSPVPVKQPHSINPPPPNFTLGTVQSDKYHFPCNHQTKTW
ncbi:hypothetical protein GOODEAATRI_026039 [Goodea atripinnis]|uniref:Uncharacterized protein n=1 Tax=Goodea atripinnis TaxID=208336 RepID=A0ABV0MV96_9TELE